MPGSRFHGGNDKVACQLPACKVQWETVFTGAPRKIQDGTLNGNRREESAGEK